MVILDTDFLSSFMKIGRLKLVLKALDAKHVIIPSTVYGELKGAAFFNALTSSFAFHEGELSDERFILVKTVDAVEGEANFSEEEIRTLGKGELGCFILAKRSGDTILIDDQRARAIAKEKGLHAVSIPTFLLFCKREHVIPLDGIKGIVEALKEKDYYELSEESRALLLK